MEIGKRILAGFIFVSIVICLTGCSTKTKNDPLEPLNRGIYSFNKAADNLFIKPVANTYIKLSPPPTRQSVSNFMQNIYEVPTFINLILQGQPGKAGKTLARLGINSTLGILGFFDIAKEMGIEPYTTNLADTFIKWGYKNSTYLVLPILGPSTVRDTAGYVGNAFMLPPTYLNPKWRNLFFIANLIDKRAELLIVEDVISSAGIDEYVLVRNLYLQKRATIIDNGDKTTEELNDYLGEPPE